MSMANLQRMAMQMQQAMERVKAELAEDRVDGTAGGGVVKAVATGDQKLVSVTIEPSAAINDALRAARELGEAKMAAVTGGLRLPGM